MKNTVKQFAHCGAKKVFFKCNLTKDHLGKKKPGVFEGVLEKNTELCAEAACALAEPARLVMMVKLFPNFRTIERTLKSRMLKF